MAASLLRGFHLGPGVVGGRHAECELPCRACIDRHRTLLSVGSARRGVFAHDDLTRASLLFDHADQPQR